MIRTDLIGTDLRHADISDARIYGVAAWDLKTDKETVQSSLIVTWPGDPIIRVDSIELAQFIYLLLNHEKLRDTINSVAERGCYCSGVSEGVASKCYAQSPRSSGRRNIYR